MKKILSYLREHIRTDFHLATYVLVAIFLIITIAINYWLDFEDSIIDSNSDKQSVTGNHLIKKHPADAKS